jgi:hypothetical protein
MVAPLSAADNTFKRDFNRQTADGQRTPMLNVFQLDSDRIRQPPFNLLDLTPEGPSPPGRNS